MALVEETIGSGYFTRMPVESPVIDPQNSIASYRSREIANGDNPKSASLCGEKNEFVWKNDSLETCSNRSH